MKNKHFLLTVLAALILFYGCTGTVSDITATVSFNDNGTGNGHVSFTSSADVGSQVRSLFNGKQNVRYTKNGDQYLVDFDIRNPHDLTRYATFNKTVSQNSTTYAYYDRISFSTLTGQDQSQSLPDFEYCVQMPANSTITSLAFQGFAIPDAVGKNKYCVTASGSTSNAGQELFVVATKMMQGCAFNNPACGEDYECDGNQCILKPGCRYNNPSCDSDYNCVNNTCMLKDGCRYSNPPCGGDFNCINNTCELKPGCSYNNPQCGQDYNCINNTCILKEGCHYNNPACDGNHTCLNNTCTLKEGCVYDNPSCHFYEICDRGGNNCNALPLYIGGAVIALLAVVVVIAMRGTSFLLHRAVKKK